MSTDRCTGSTSVDTVSNSAIGKVSRRKLKFYDVLAALKPSRTPRQMKRSTGERQIIVLQHSVDKTRLFVNPYILPGFIMSL